MKIRRRLSDKERLRRLLPKGSSKAAKHPMLCAVAKALGKDGAFLLGDLAKAMAADLSRVDTTSLQSNVIKLCLDNALLMSGYDGFLEDGDRLRMNNAIKRNSDKLYAANWQLWHIWVWDIYHAPVPDSRPFRIKPKPKYKQKHR